MPTRAFFLVTILLLCAFLLSLIVSVSLPALPTLDIVRFHFTGDAPPHVSTDTESIKEIRVRHLPLPSLSSFQPLTCLANQNFHFVCHSSAYGESKLVEETAVSDRADAELQGVLHL